MVLIERGHGAVEGGGDGAEKLGFAGFNEAVG
jgi:hypothetical protein